MKWLIASDIHGSAKWCERLMEVFEQEGADRMLLLGDILFNDKAEPDKQAVADMLNAVADRITCVRGNCDGDGDLAMLAFPVEEDYVRIPIGEHAMFATHGHLYNETNLPPRMDEGDVLIHGHTHVPKTRPYRGYLCCNPGSVSIPLWGSRRGYMTYEDGVFRWMTLDDGAEYRRYEL